MAETSEKFIISNLPLMKVDINLPENHDKIKWLDYIPTKDSRIKEKFVEAYGIGVKVLGNSDKQTASYYSMPSSINAQLAKVTNELHQMFVRATDHVCKHPEIWNSFGFPEEYWQRALDSFYKGDKVISGRLDFSITQENGIKCFEYNADSASCLFECAETQDAWGKAAGISKVGVSGGIETQQNLINAWNSIDLPKDTLIHFLYDENPEEEYHTLYMMSTAEQAGLRGKSYSNVDAFSFNEKGLIVDENNEVVKYVWKTWAYFTLMDQWKGQKLQRSGTVRLIDVCFNEDIIVYEPLWTAIPASKAILPVLSELYPNHPNLLYTSWELTDDMKRTGYVTKPILGRCGENVQLHQPDNVNILSTQGRFDKNSYVYQALCMLPLVGNEYIQVNTWAVGGKYAGTILRVDNQAIMNLDSWSVCLRVVDYDAETEKKDYKENQESSNNNRNQQN